MNFPNKIFTYRESVISKLTVVLEEISREPQTVQSIYKKLSGKFTGVVEYMYVLDCLYALGKIDIDDKEKLILNAD